MASKEPTPEARELLRLAAEDYAKHNNTSPDLDVRLAAAARKTGQVMGQIAAQRGANKIWGKTQIEPQGD